MITASIRRDAYSAFGEKEPWATFPSVALAWTFTNEKFFKWEPMSMGKLRLSWGLNGNRAINDPYLALATLDIGAKMFGYLDASGNLKEMEYLKIGRMANPNLKWEKSEAYNVGLDFGFPEQPHHRFFGRLCDKNQGYDYGAYASSFHRFQ